MGGEGGSGGYNREDEALYQDYLDRRRVAAARRRAVAAAVVALVAIAILVFIAP